ncbi:MAG: DUF167 domain-containing protein [Fimbriimonadaceae bacterium]
MSGETSCRLSVRVTPRASANRLERTDRVIRVWVTASPTDGQANDAVSKLLAGRLGIAVSRVRIVRGATSRDKTFEVAGLAEAEALARL